jgi:hypothetical protein
MDQPSEGSNYYVVNIVYGMKVFITEFCWGNYTNDIANFEIGNCFKTRREANQMKQALVEILRDRHIVSLADSKRILKKLIDLKQLEDRAKQIKKAHQIIILLLEKLGYENIANTFKELVCEN